MFYVEYYKNGKINHKTLMLNLLTLILSLGMPPQSSLIHKSPVVFLALLTLCPPGSKHHLLPGYQLFQTMADRRQNLPQTDHGYWLNFAVAANMAENLPECILVGCADAKHIRRQYTPIPAWLIFYRSLRPAAIHSA